MRISIPFRWLNKDSGVSGWLGFRLGINGTFNDYRDSAVRGTGLNFGITRTGKLFYGEFVAEEPSEIPITSGRLILEFNDGNRTLTLQLEQKDPVVLQIPDTLEIPAGGIALVSHLEANSDQPAIAFGDFEVRGESIMEKEDRAYGPVMFNQYTLDSGTLKYTAQLSPVGDQDDNRVYFQVLSEEDSWITIAEADLDSVSRTATFRVNNWKDGFDRQYRVEYGYKSYGDTRERSYYTGTIRKNPVDKQDLVVAGFTGNNDLGFPNKDLTDNVKKHDPDLLFFSGDQIYEGVGGYGVQRSPTSKAVLDYLRKWYIFGWTYRDLLRDRPAVSIPDDHDVYHGNIWGAGGISTPVGLTGSAAQDQGGYKMPPDWVNMVQRTQTSHLPDPFDPTPVAQDIGVYYTDMVYGKVSFAILEDRKFKSAPGPILPDAKVDNGWASNLTWNARESGDVEGAILLGARQEDFLEDWVRDWSGGAEMKVVLSQTIFANVATLPESESNGRVIPRLRILEEGEYPPDDRPVSDMDSNGWPQSARDNALKIMRKGFAFHLAGDQHLGSLIQYGVEEYGDSGYAFCVPSVSNIWPRRWYPAEGGANRKEGIPKYTGDFEDGFGNKITVHAISNPVFTGREPANLYDRATGYGILRINSDWRAITVECWPRDSDPTIGNARQYPGWPLMVTQLQQYGKKIVSRLPNMIVDGYDKPVFDVIDESTGELVYSIRSSDNSFQPFVFKEGDYSVRVSIPGTNLERTYESLNSGTGGAPNLMVRF